MFMDKVKHLLRHDGRRSPNGKPDEAKDKPNIELASWWRFHIVEDLERLGVRCHRCLRVHFASAPTADDERWLLDVSAGCSTPATLEMNSHLAQYMAKVYAEAGADEEMPDEFPCRIITKIRVYNLATGEERNYRRDLGVTPPW